LSGDFNIDIASSNANGELFEELLLCYGFDFLLREPTRITSHSQTCIDNIISNKNKKEFSLSVVELGLSDHAAQLLLKYKEGATKKAKKNSLNDFSTQII
jgi:hypothetical protein